MNEYDDFYSEGCAADSIIASSKSMTVEETKRIQTSLFIDFQRFADESRVQQASAELLVSQSLLSR
jgi:hypothetical protein